MATVDPKTPPIIAAHIAVILFAYSSPFWLDWRLVTAGIFLYYLQIALFGGCVLSLAQFRGEKMSFHEWYLAKLGIQVNRRRLKFFLDRILPGFFFILAIVVQVVFGMRPLVKL